MPIYEFACPHCRVIFSFLSKRINPDKSPRCPKCGRRKLSKQVSGFSMLRGAKAAPPDEWPAGPNAGSAAIGAASAVDDPRLERAMAEIEQEMEHLDENNPRHLASVMQKMRDALPPGSMPKDLDIAIQRLEAGESPEKIEEDMGDILGQGLGGEGEDDDSGTGGFGAGSFARDPQLHEY